ncbi:chaperone protein DnaJ [Bosea sp. BIWAKO-01]|nr:chaperone protein DnaJ [Bosea sp. BIWAKO-01]
MGAKIEMKRPAATPSSGYGLPQVGAAASPKRTPHGRLRRQALFLTCTALVAAPLSAWAVTFNANDAASLQAAIAAVNSGAADTINITGNITLTSELPPITAAVTINGNGNTVSGNNQYRVLFVAAPSGAAVNISNVTLADGYAKGGNGGGGGGGGMGAGGAIFAMSGANTLTDVGFSGNRAQGGNGGTGATGGGGGLGGNGSGPGGFISGGGGGIGVGATGGTNSTGGGAGILPGAGGGSASSTGGGANGGGGGGSSAGSGGGGGGVGGGNSGGSAGGSGGFGGGGGGSGSNAAGNGGFGGGGGGGYQGTMTGGWGGFGGGGGAAINGPGGSVYGGGGGGSSGLGGGGGGMGAGGAVFVCSATINASCGATLTISNNANKTIDGTVVAGISQGSGGAGTAQGGSLFLTNGTVGNISVASGTTTTISGSIVGTGDGGIALSGGGTLALTSTTNSFNGISVSGTGSTLSVAAPGSVTGTIALADRTRLHFAGGGNYGNAATVAGVTTLDTGGVGNTVTYSGQISNGSGAGAIEVIGGGTLALTNIANSYSNGTTVKGNTTLSLNDDRVLGASTGGLTLGDATSFGRVASTAGFSSARAIVLGQGGGEFAPGLGATVTLSGTVSGTGGVLRVAGPGRLVLTASNSYDGGTEVTGGTLAISHNNALGSGTLTLADQSTLLLNSGGMNVANAMKLRGTANFAIASGSQSTYSGVISDDSGPAGLSVSGSGKLILTGANSYSGGTTISAATTLQLGNGATNGTIVGPVVNNGTLAFETLGSVGFGGTVTGTGALTKLGSGTLTLTGAVGSTGATNINGGTLAIGAGGSLASTGTVWLNASTAVLDLNGHALTIGGLGGSFGEVKLGNSGVLTLGGSGNNYLGIISGAGSVIKSGGSTQVLAGENTYTGGTTISSGALQIGMGGTTGSIIGNVVNNGLIAFNRSDDYTFAGNISGTGGMIKSSTGVLTLTGVHTFTGETNVSAGTLQIGDGVTDGSFAGSIFNIAHVIFNTGGSSSYAGSIYDTSGPAGTLTKTGAGTLTLTGANTYRGGTTVSAGTLALGGHGRLLGDGAVTVVAGATFDVGGYAQGVGALSGAGTVQLGSGGALTVGNADASSTFAGSIIGGGSLTKAGTGTFTLTGANSFTGGTTISGGTLQIGDGAGTGSLVGNVVNNATLAFNRTGSLTLAGDILGTGALTKSGTGTLTLAGAASHTGGTTISAGALQIGDGGTIGAISGNILNNGALSFKRSNELSYAGVISGSGSLTQAGGGTLTLTAANTYSGGTTISAGILRIGNDGTNDGSVGGAVFNDGTFEFDNLNAASIAGVISGNGALRKLGSNTLTLTGASTYYGPTSIAAGTLRLGGNNRLNASGDVSVSSGASFDLGGFSQAIGALSGAGEVKLGSGGALSTGRATDAIFAGVISGAGSLTKTGTGRLTLAGDNTFTGSTTIAAGTLQIGDAGTAGALATDVSNSGVLAFNRTDEHIFDKVISDGVGAGSVEQNGTGRTIFTGANTYTGGTTVNAGALQIGNGGAAGSIAGSVTVASGAEFAVKRSDIYALPNAVSGAGSFAQRGTGTTVLGDGMTYSGGTVIEAGTLKVGSGGAQGSLGSGAIANAGALVIDKNNAVMIAGAISGTGSFETTGGTGGSGVTKLSGASTYTGATTVSGGTLEVSGSLGNTAVTVQSGATLAGAGSITGAVTVASGARLAPGANPGTLATGTLTVGALVLSSGSQLDFDLGLPNLPAGSGSDRVDVTGNLTLAGTLNVANAGGFGGGIYRLFNYGGTLTNNGVVLGTLPGGVSAGDLSVQTSVSSQVNLVNSNGLTLKFWDGGAAGNANNGAIDGGAGIWSATSGNWTNQDGSINAPAAPAPGFMVFQGTAGIVTVDTSLGAVSATGMQFDANGYRIEGGALALSGTQAIIRVGDGTTGGASYVATIASNLTGASELVKTDFGTLVLSGTNSYTGGTLLNAGTLSVSADGNLGQAAGGLAFNGGVLRVTGTSFTSTSRTVSWGSNGGGFDIADAANSFTLSQALSGTGGLAKLGAGTLVLTGTNSHTGGTTISAGTLQVGAGSTTGEITGAVVNNGRLAFNRSDSVTFAGAISGSGALTQMGSGTLTLTGANSYTGGTAISAGTLQIGDGGTTGAISGNVANSGTLAFKRSDLVAFSGQISGTGALKQLGTGTLNLTGVNTYSGGTTITAGTLRGSATSFGSGAILNNAALVIDQNSDAQFANAINGNGRFTKTGTGSLNLTGTSTLSGPTTIAAGRLAVNGSLANSAVTVESGATLGGNGTIGRLNVLSGGIVAPGNSIGTLTVNGNVLFAPGSIYQVEVNGAGQSDQIISTGTITVSGATLAIAAISGSMPPSARFKLFDAAGGVSGQFNSVTSNFAFLTTGLSYDASQTYLTIARNDASFGSVGQTRNQTSLGAAGERLGTGNPVYDAIVKLDAPSARQAFDALSGEVHASAQSILVEDSTVVRTTAIDRLRSAFGTVAAAQQPVMTYGFTADMAAPVTGPMPRLVPNDRFAVWGQGFGSWGRNEAQGGVSKLSRSSGGFLLGADAAVFDNWRVGLYSGYSRSTFEAKGRISSGNSDNYHLGLYGGGQWGALGLRAGAAYSWHDLTVDRTVSFTGFSDRLRGDYNAATAQVFGELGYRIDAGRVALEPFAGLAYVNLQTDGFSERGGTAALASRSSDMSTAFSTLGMRASTTVTVNGMALELRGALAWRHAFGDVMPASLLSFAGGTPFSITGIPIAKNAAVLDAGLDLAVAPNARLSLSYGGQYSAHAIEQTVKGSLAVKF